MVKNAAVVFAPAYHTGPPDRSDHDVVGRVFELAGLDFHFHQPDWRQPDPVGWASGMAEHATGLMEQDYESVILAGFSMGGLTAILAAQRLQRSRISKFGGVAGMSFSPFFGEEWVRRSRLLPKSGIHSMPESLQYALCDLDLPALTCPVQLYAGTEEVPTVQEVHADALRLWPQAVSIRPACDHSITAGPYLTAIRNNIGALGMGAHKDELH